MAEKSEQSSAGILERSAPILLIAVIAMAFTTGALWQKVKNLENGLGTKSSAVAGQKATPTSTPQIPTSGKLPDSEVAKIPTLTDADHLRGSADAKVTLIEYSDYYCPFCARFHPTAQQMLKEYGGQVAWVYRHFPLDTLHPNARPVAELSECIAELNGEDAFWTFTDSLYEETPTDVDAAIMLAVNQGLNRTALESCFNEGKYKDLVDSHYKGGLAAGVTGTPGNIIINNQGEAWRLPGAVPFENLKTTLDQALGD